ncbi:hypothetical protein F4808DRAFT_377277 [Astrocystis sublimbata]|nr:hypothetical protein F4808DRAFT_377277 [Astrocystis sublimbata]
MAKLTNYIAFVNPENGLDQIGHFDIEANTIQPLSFLSGTPVKNLYQVIEAGSPDALIAAGSPIAADTVKILPAISGRDVLAVGKNYMEHAKEFNSSGFDSSDKVDRPSHPVIFTKRATAIVAHGEDILLHENFTATADYEGEIGVILGKPGYRINEEDAWEYVWGYTIINDVTARERQRDHKQFFIGKSADTYCPIGPIAVPKEDLPKTLRVQTQVNGELQQNSTTDDLIFPIPELLAVMSSGQTLQAGDVLATGTPAGVGIGKQPPVFLKPGDEISISVTGLGTLTNRVAQPGAINSTLTRVSSASAFEMTNATRTAGRTGASLTTINGKPTSYQCLGSGDKNTIFVYGLGGTKEYWTPLITQLRLDRSERGRLHLYDFEGHGLSPTHPLNELTITSLAADLAGVFNVAGVSASAPATLVAHSTGCLVAMRFIIDNPGLVKKLLLMSPPPFSSSDASGTDQFLAPTPKFVRRQGMASVADLVVEKTVSDATKRDHPLAVAAVRLSLLGQDPEGYAKACQAFLGATAGFEVGEMDVDVEALIVAGGEDQVSTRAGWEGYEGRIRGSRVEVVGGVGHWPVFEDLGGVCEAVGDFLTC